MDSKKSNKISDIVRLRQILKKWKKAASSSSSSPKATSTCNNSNSTKGINFIKRTLSFTDISTAAGASSSSTNNDAVPKGYLAVCVGKELKRYVIPTEYLSHQAFGLLLREAEEEFGFQQEGVLKFPCQVTVFDKVLELVEDRKRSGVTTDLHFFHPSSSPPSASAFVDEQLNAGCWSPDHYCELPLSHHPHLYCR